MKIKFYLHRTPALLKKLYPSLVWFIPTNKKELFITFDDGPQPEVTPYVLDQLAKYNTKATFFCVGANVNKHPEIMSRIVEEGHAIANHTYNHLNGWDTDLQLYLKNVAECDQSLGQFHQSESTLFRPPYGRITRNQIKTLKVDHTIIMWDYLIGDFDQALNIANALKKAIKNIRPGSIALFHDSLKSSNQLKQILPAYLKNLYERGFTSRPITADLFQ